MLSSHHSKDEKGGKEVGEKSTHISSFLPSTGSGWRKMQPSITAYVCCLPSIILVITLLMFSEPEKSHFLVILQRDIIKQNSQPKHFTVQNVRNQRAKKHYNFLKKLEKWENEDWIFKHILMFIHWNIGGLNIDRNISLRDIISPITVN